MASERSALSKAQTRNGRSEVTTKRGAKVRKRYPSRTKRGSAEVTVRHRDDPPPEPIECNRDPLHADDARRIVLSAAQTALSLPLTYERLSVNVRG